MSDPAKISAEKESIEQLAATWVLRRDRGFSAAEQDEFLQWLATDARHGRAFALHQRNWSRLDLLAQWRPEHAPRPNRDLLAPRPRRLVRFVPLMLAAAALVALGLYLPWRSFSGPVAPLPAVAARVILPAAIERRTLDDGSVVELNRGAEISVRFIPEERRVSLVRGEAHFTVTKNPARPFVVSAAGVDVRAVGTAFDVLLGPTSVEVLVTEGRVEVDPPVGAAGSPPSPVSVGVGERSVISFALVAPPPQTTAVTAQQTAVLLAWQPQMLEFTAVPLAEIVEAFNRHNRPVRLVVADSALGATPLSASLRSDNLDGFVRLLEAGFSVRVERSGDTVVLLPPASR